MFWIGHFNIIQVDYIFCMIFHMQMNLGECMARIDDDFFYREFQTWMVFFYFFLSMVNVGYIVNLPAVHG